MDKENLTLTFVGYALVGLVYAGFALRLLALGTASPPRNKSALYLLFAVVFSAVWGVCQLLSVISPWWLLLGQSGRCVALRLLVWVHAGPVPFQPGRKAARGDGLAAHDGRHLGAFESGHADPGAVWF